MRNCIMGQYFQEVKFAKREDKKDTEKNVDKKLPIHFLNPEISRGDVAIRRVARLGG